MAKTDVRRHLCMSVAAVLAGESAGGAPNLWAEEATSVARAGTIQSSQEETRCVKHDDAPVHGGTDLTQNGFPWDNSEAHRWDSPLRGHVPST